MDCRTCLGLMLDHAWGETPDADAVRHHLAECTTCAAANDALRSDLDAIGAALRDPPTDQARARLLQDAEAHPAWRRLADRRVPIWQAAAAVLLAGFAGWWLARPGSAPVESTDLLYDAPALVSVDPSHL